jgi:hypothetical protein
MIPFLSYLPSSTFPFFPLPVLKHCLFWHPFPLTIWPSQMLSWVVLALFRAITVLLHLCRDMCLFLRSIRTPCAVPFPAQRLAVRQGPPCHVGPHYWRDPIRKSLIRHVEHGGQLRSHDSELRISINKYTPKTSSGLRNIRELLRFRRRISHRLILQTCFLGHLIRSLCQLTNGRSASSNHAP